MLVYTQCTYRRYVQSIYFWLNKPIRALGRKKRARVIYTPTWNPIVTDFFMGEEKGFDHWMPFKAGLCFQSRYKDIHFFQRRRGLNTLKLPPYIRHWRNRIEYKARTTHWFWFIILKRFFRKNHLLSAGFTDIKDLTYCWLYLTVFWWTKSSVSFDENDLF